MANWPDTAVGTPGSATSTRRIEREKVANWNSSAASRSNDIYLIIAGNIQVAEPPFSDGSSGRVGGTIRRQSVGSCQECS